MQPEIEVKFLDVNHEALRLKLIKISAKCQKPMQLLRRTLFDYPDKRLQKTNHGRLRIRDENDQVLINYKSKNKSNYADELETAVGSYELMSELLIAIGMEAYSYQESKRETWLYKNTEIVLDEWPWLNPYIEIEGPDEPTIQMVAKELGFEWKDAAYGSVDTAYMHQYPGMLEGDSVGNIEQVRFDLPIPKYLQDRLVP